MSEREKRLLKRQQALLEKEKEELREKMEKQRKLIKALQDEKRKEGKSEDVDRDPIRPSDQTDVDLQANRREQSPKSKGAIAERERVASGGRSLAESSTAEFNTVDEIGESPVIHKDLTTKRKEVTTPSIDLDFEARYRRLKQSLTDSLERSRIFSKAHEKQVEQAKAAESLSYRSTDNEDELSLSLAPYLKRNREEKEEIEEKISVGKQLSADSMEEIRGDVFVPAELDEEERQLLDQIRKLELQERILETGNRQRATEEAHRIEIVKELRSRQQLMDERIRRSQRIKALKEKEIETERRVSAKVKAQIELDNRLRILLKEEEELSLYEKRFKVEPEAQSTPKPKVNFQPLIEYVQDPEEHEWSRREDYSCQTETKLRQKEDGERQTAEIYERQSSQRSESNAQMSEQQSMREQELNRKEEYVRQKEADLQKKEEKLRQAAEINERLLILRKEPNVQVSDQVLKEQELNRREEYLRQLETELQQKEKEIRGQLKLNVAKPGCEQDKEASRDPDIKLIDTGSSAVKQTEIDSLIDKQNITGSSVKKQIDSSNADSKQKEISPFLKPYINFFSGTEPVPKNESKFEEWKVEIECLRKSSVYPEYIVNQALRNSLKGQARRVLFTLGPEATTEQILQKLEKTFGNVASGQTVLQEFYTAEQRENESVTLWGIRLEEIYQRAVEKGFASYEERDKMLIERFWRSLRSIELQNATSVHYHSAQSFEVLRQKVRAEEYAMATHKSAIEKGDKKESEKNFNIKPIVKPTLVNTSHASEEAVKIDIPQVQHQPVLQDPVTYKMVKDLAAEVASMKKLLEQCSKLGSDRGNQGRWNRQRDFDKDKNSTVPKKIEENKKSQPNK